MKAETVHVIVCLVFFSTSASECLSSNADADIIGLRPNHSTKSLVDKLLKGYGRTSVRPVHDHTQPTIVFIRLLLYELVEFNEQYQVITMRSNMKMKWRDEFLQWDPREWDNITSVTLSNHDIWRPDFDLEQNVDRDQIITSDTYISVTHTGAVHWMFPMITTTACKIYTAYFPYDHQQCNVTFYPWTLGIKEMRLFALNDDDAQQKAYVRNGVWDLTSFQATNATDTFKCCPHPFDMVVYTLQLRREASFYTMQIVLPSVFLTLLMLVGFWLHPDTGEKISLTVTNLLSMILFQQLVAQHMPPIGEPSSIVVNCCFIMIALSVSSVILTIIVLRVYHNDSDQMPPFWGFMLLRIFISRNIAKNMSSFYKKRRSMLKLNRGDERQASFYLKVKSRLPSSGSTTESNSSMKGRMTNGMADCEEDLNYSFMWKHFALAIDRAFGIILSVCTVGCIVYALEAFSHRH
ncbi:neuronal acetylcholine receptor subunit alpha-9-like isoform X1 [Lytechinus variegatus]|uniref:neuronal acetylcholine receptor subunit alpha-9-like isoform X1 n=1 Tax=Lytechinus variegatus TaxID=7654 RepID=UPI001BB109E6|nr:neuronal acetylcholine receptor subunit alpha-9-like isoform X1 [Lytechinus variegatus]